MRKVPSLKRLAAEAVQTRTILTDLPHDIAALVKYYRGEVRTCEHGTAWTYKHNNVNGVVMYTCRSVEK